MEKCVRASCKCLAGDSKVEIDGKVYCSQECADKCTDEVCKCQNCKCAKAETKKD